MKNCMKTQKNRRLFFGYDIVDGKRVVNPSEAAVVKWLFEKYVSGYSYKRLAALLEDGSVKYRSDDSSWNKNMVQRILSREEYCGTNGYPQIIDQETYDIVQSMRNRKAEYLAVKLDWPKEFREKIYCYHCGSRIVRKHPGTTINWQCQSEGRTTNDFITDEVLQDEIVNKINQIIQNPKLLQIEEETSFSTSLAIMQANNEIVKQIQQKERDKKEIELLIFHAAAMRYQSCSALDNTYYTKELMELYSRSNISEKPDYRLIEHSVKRILLASNGQIYFEMINGKTI